MTLDDLLKVFEKGFQAKLQSEDYPREAFATPTLNRAGIHAVVEALRDDTAINSCACKFWLDDILGDAGEK